MVKIAPSFLTPDFLNLRADVERMNACTDLFHMDVMDGNFVPNISYGTSVVRAVGEMASRPLDVHLMVKDPALQAPLFAVLPNVEMVSFHLEALSRPEPLLRELRAKGVKAGLVVNPDFPLDVLFTHLDHCDFVVIMSVFAGMGGQKFIPESFERVKALKEEIMRRSLDVMIEVDGGVNQSNARQLAACGADILVSGSAMFGSQDLAATVAAMR